MFQILALCCLDGGPVTSMSLAIVMLTAKEALSQTQFVRLGGMLYCSYVTSYTSYLDIGLAFPLQIPATFFSWSFKISDT